jgi:hypothetical protein
VSAPHRNRYGRFDRRAHRFTARYFASHAAATHEMALRDALARKRVLWIRAALKRGFEPRTFTPRQMSLGGSRLKFGTPPGLRAVPGDAVVFSLFDVYSLFLIAVAKLELTGAASVIAMALFGASTFGSPTFGSLFFWAHYFLAHRKWEFWLPVRAKQGSRPAYAFGTRYRRRSAQRPRAEGSRFAICLMGGDQIVEGDDLSLSSLPLRSARL